MDNKKVLLLGKLIKYVFIILGLVLCAWLIFGPNLNKGTIKVDEFRYGFELSAATLFTGFILFICMALIVLFFILQLIRDFKKAIRPMFGILICLLLYLIFRIIGTSDTSSTLHLKNAVSNATVDATHAGLMTLSVCLIIAIILIIAGPFLGRLRK